MAETANGCEYLVLRPRTLEYASSPHDFLRLAHSPAIVPKAWGKRQEPYFPLTIIQINP